MPRGIYVRKVTKTLAERFWAKVKKTNGCWEWTAARNRAGYGVIDRGRGGGSALAHRVSWELHRGRIIKGMSVCHVCDNARCVRPSHLFMGTQRDNILDARRKGRLSTGDAHRRRLQSPSGEQHWNAKLSHAKAKRIRELWAMGVSQKQIMRQFGISHSTVHRVTRGTGPGYGKWKEG